MGKQPLLVTGLPRRWTVALVALALLLCGVAPPPAVASTTTPLDYGLHEEVRWLQPSEADDPSLEVTLFRPRSPGPFPLIVVNHGRSPGPARAQPRYRPLHVAYEFVRRGYAVVVPMREGFAGSGGVEHDTACDLAENARRQGRSVRAAVQWAQRQPWADPTRVVVVGASQGGLATLAYGEEPLPGTRLLVNISGGLRMPTCPGWEADLVDTLAGLAAPEVGVPSLWVYSENDSHFSPPVWRAAHERYTQRGGDAELRSVGHFGSDGHLLFAARDGVPRWLPVVLERMSRLGLPNRIDPLLDDLLDTPKGTRLHQAATPAEAERWVRLGPSARQGYLQWLGALSPKAFAVSDDGRHWSSVWGEPKPAGKALEHCARRAGVRCQLFAVDNFLVSGSD
jgi:dienelactone hydrolase